MRPKTAEAPAAQTVPEEATAPSVDPAKQAKDKAAVQPADAKSIEELEEENFRRLTAKKRPCPNKEAKQKDQQAPKKTNMKEKPTNSKKVQEGPWCCWHDPGLWTVSWCTQWLQTVSGPLLQWCQNSWKAGLERPHGKEGEGEGQVEAQEEVKC